MENVLKAFHLPFTFIVLILAYQTSIYMFYRYFQIKDEKLEGNKILIAYGLLYLFGFTGIGIRSISSYYIKDLIINNFLLDFSHILISFATFSFLLIVSQKSFNELINTNLAKILCIITFVLSLLILIISNIILYAILVIVSLIIGSFFMLVFHLKLIQKSTGNIKKRIVLLLIGEILIIIIIVIGAEKNPYFFNPVQQQIVALIYNPLLILGQMIVLLAIYNFPIFLEFNWQDNIIKLIIIDNKQLEILYYYDFIREENKKRDIKEDSSGLKTYNNIFPGGIIGMETIISVITKSRDSKIEKLQHGESLILLEDGGEDMNFLTFCILVKKEMISIKYFLKIVKNKFKEIYKNILFDLEVIEEDKSQFFLEFNNEISKILKIT